MKKPMPPKDLYADLGVPKSASREQIKRSYRKRVKRAHPDVKGSAEQFMALQLAYDVLSDDTLRARYDATGEYDTSERSEELELFVHEFMKCVDENPDDNALLRTMQGFRRVIAELEQQIDHLLIRKAKLSQSIKNYQRKDKGENLIASALQQQIDAIDRSERQGRSRLEMVRKAQSVAEQYEFVGQDPETFYKNDVWMTFGKVTGY